MIASFLLLASLLVAPAQSAEGQSAGEIAEEVLVYGDPFARWDGTRWHVRTQLGFPVPYVLYAVNNKEFEPVAIDLDFTMACEKTWRRSKKRHEVDCRIEALGIRGAKWRVREPAAQEILDSVDTMLTGATIQLIVADDGRLMNIDLEGVPAANEREQAVREQARMLLVRAMTGFHMKLPPRSQIRAGQWVEYESTLFEIPMTPPAIGLSIAGGESANQMDSRRTQVAVNSIGGSFIIHQLDKYRGHLIVQSVGEGTVLVSQDNGSTSGFGDNSAESYFKINLNGVAIYDDETGVMSERVWSMRGRTSAGSALGDGRADSLYFHNGRIRLLKEEEQVDVGFTGLILRPGELGTGPKWEALE